MFPELAVEPHVDERVDDGRRVAEPLGRHHRPVGRGAAGRVVVVAQRQGDVQRPRGVVS